MTLQDDDRRSQTREQDADRKGTEPTPAAGPHARKDLTNPMATPGAGTLPDEKYEEGGVSS